MKWTKRQIEFSADWVKGLSLVLVPGSAADAVVDGSRLGLDIVGLCLGLGCFAMGMWLTGKLDGDTV